ncbi:MAG: hypothetical protein ABFS14_06190 [Gemmatimonadota bacterium]
MRNASSVVLRAAVTVTVWSAAFAVSLHATGVPAFAQEESANAVLTPGRVLTLVKGRQPAEVREPSRALLADDGRLFLTDTKKADVLWYDENLIWRGNLAAAHPDRTLGKPIRTVLDSGGRIYVADADSRRIHVFKDGTFLGSRGGRGNTAGRFGSLDDIAIDSDDMLWAADGAKGQIYVFSPTGLLERVVRGFQRAVFDRPVMVVVDPARDVYVYDAGAKSIIAGRPDGSLRWTLDLQQLLGGKDLFDMDIDPTGALYLVTRDKSRVAIVEPTGKLREEIFGPVGRPKRFDRLSGLSISGARGAMILVDQKDLIVQEMRMTFPAGGAFLQPSTRSFLGVAVDTLDGRVLAVTSSSAGQGGRVVEYRLLLEAQRLVIRSADGERVGEILLPGALPQTLVAVGASDGFVIADRTRRLHRVSLTGEVIASLPLATAGGELKRPTALAWRSSDGTLAVYDRDDDEIQLLSADGTFKQRVGRRGRSEGEISRVEGMVFRADGQLLVLDLEGSRLQRFDEHGIFARSEIPVALGSSSGATAVGIGADVWGRTFLLDKRTGLVTQIGEDGAECQIGAPWLLQPLSNFAVSLAGDMFVSGGAAGQTIRFRCKGPPPEPEGLRLTLDLQPPGLPVLQWDAGLPGAVSYEVMRRIGDREETVGSARNAALTLASAAWGDEPGEIFVRGVNAEGKSGRWSAPISDRLTPAMRALSEGRDLPAAEAWLAEELVEAESAGRADRAPLLAAYVRTIIGQGDYERASSELDSREQGLGTGLMASVRAEIARAAVTESVASGTGEGAIAWLESIAGAAPESLSAVERLALELDRGGDSENASSLLRKHGSDRSLAGTELIKALAEVQLEAGQTRSALATLVQAAAGTQDPTAREYYDQSVFELATQIADGFLSGAIMDTVSDLTQEQLVDRMTRDLRLYATSTAVRPDDQWELRLAALAAKSRISSAVRMEASDFAGARELYNDILDRTAFLIDSDRTRIRAHLGALALAQGNEEEAITEFGYILAGAPGWEPNADEYSPSVRDFVARMRAGEIPAPEVTQ